jgi:CHAD domain-containing protein
VARFELTDNRRIEPGQPAEEAARVIFAVLLADLRKNVPGAIEGCDPEHLHDLRVASRRTRSLLTQLKGVLPKGKSRFFAKEFKWLGGLTGPCRDLDVWLLDRADQRTRLTAAEVAVLAPLDERIAIRRAQALTEVSQGLTSIRFGSILKDWDAFLQTPTTTAEPPANARRAIKKVTDKRITKAYQRVVHGSRDLDVDSPARVFHRLRIDAKKLRYLLECFRTLYQEAIIETHVGLLKKLQDALGGFNDTVVQQRYLAELRCELVDEVNAETERAIDQLVTTLADRQLNHRRTLLKELCGLIGAKFEF